MDFGLDTNNHEHYKAVQKLTQWQQQEIKVGDSVWSVWALGYNPPVVIGAKVLRVGRAGGTGPILRVELQCKSHLEIAGFFDVNGIMPSKEWAKVALHYTEYLRSVEKILKDL